MKVVQWLILGILIATLLVGGTYQNNRIKRLEEEIMGYPPQGVAAGAETANSILEKIQQFLGVYWFNNHWLPSEMVGNGVSGSGSLTWEDYRVVLKTGTTSGSEAYLFKQGYGLGHGETWDKKRLFGCLAEFLTYAGNYAHLVSGGISDHAAVANTAEHIGFKLIDNILYGTVGDGTNESTLEIATLAGTFIRRHECVLDPGNECRFYYDGVDKGVITTNLPSGINYSTMLLRASIYNTIAANKEMFILNSRIFQEE